jgi:hypothetical protein
VSIIRAPRPESHFTLVRNETLRDSRLSYRARGVLATILSRPDDWSTTIESLSRDGSDGVHAVRSAMKELEEVGYVIRRRERDARGRIRTVTLVFDMPQEIEEAREGEDSKTCDSPEGGLPEGGPPNGGSAERGEPHSFKKTVSKKTTYEEQEQKTQDQELAFAEAPAPAPMSQELVLPLGDDLTVGVVPSDQHDSETQGQRVNRLARTYTDRVKMSNFLAVRSVVARALKADYTDRQVIDGLITLADENRPVTIDTLRIAVEGMGRAKGRDRDQEARDRVARFEELDRAIGVR